MPISNLSFRATGIMAYLKNGGTLEKAAAMANHASILPRRDISDRALTSFACLKELHWDRLPRRLLRAPGPRTR